MARLLGELRFYLDENVPTEVARQLRQSGIDAVSAGDLNLLGRSDLDHLRQATADGRVLCTHDQDFLRLAAEGAAHSGIVFLPQARGGIGGWVRALRALHARYEATQVQGRVFFGPP